MNLNKSSIDTKVLPGIRAARPQVWIIIGIVLITLGAYIQVIKFDFVTFDDPIYITRNHVIQAGFNWQSLKYAFTSGDDGSYLPMVWLSHAICVSIFKQWAGGHHLVNLIIHILNSVLLFGFLKKMTNNIWPSAVVAFLFALHPLHVESVAWIAERKDVLSTFFWILTLWAYLNYCETRTLGRYMIVIGLFSIGLLSKSMLVTLPFTLLLLDIWPLGRFKITDSDGQHHGSCWAVVREKIPLFCLSLSAAGATFYIQRHIGAVAPSKGLPLPIRLENAALSTMVYLKQTFIPIRLSAFYPYAWVKISWTLWVGSLVLIIVITLVSLYLIKKMPYIFVGWGWYLVTLLPVIGIIQVGSQSHADRYTYVPLIGLFVALSWLGQHMISKAQLSRKTLLVIGSSLMGVCFSSTFAQVYIWKDNLTLFKNALSFDETNPVALLNIGDEYMRRMSYQNAFAAYYQAVLNSSGLYLSHSKAGSALELLNNPEGALIYYQNANMLKPGLISIDQKMGHVLTSMGRFEEAEPHVKRVIAHPEQAFDIADPVDPQPSWVDWATILIARNQISEAREALAQGLTRDPKHPNKIPTTICFALMQLKRFEDALREAQLVQEANPKDPDLMYVLGLAYIRLHKFSEARSVFESLRKLDPHSPLIPVGLAQLEIAVSSI